MVEEAKQVVGDIILVYLVLNLPVVFAIRMFICLLKLKVLHQRMY